MFYYSSTYKRTAVKSVIVILLGLVLVIWPTEVLNSMVKIIGGVFCVTGIVSFLVSYRNREERSAMNMSSFNGIGSIILGLLLFFMADFFTDMLMYVLGFLLIVAGIGQLVVLTSARRWGSLSPVSYIFPVLILIAGVIVIANPFETKESFVILFGIMSIFYGVTDLINQYHINKLRKEVADKTQEEKLGRHEIEDAEYEDVKDE